MGEVTWNNTNDKNKSNFLICAMQWFFDISLYGEHFHPHIGLLPFLAWHVAPYEKRKWKKSFWFAEIIRIVSGYIIWHPVELAEYLL